MPNDTIYHDQEGNLVSDSQIILSGKTYTVGNISYVTVSKIPPKKGCLISLILCVIFFILSSLAIIAEGEEAGFAIFLVSISVLAGLLVWLFRRKPMYALRLGLGMGEVRAFTIRDRDLVFKIRDAIERSIKDK